MKKISLFLIGLTLFYFSNAQNGKLIDIINYSLADTNIQKLKKIDPDIEKVLSVVNFSAITYLSDGLKIKGYVAVPKEKGVYPCIIYNRGGNKNFGALDDYELGIIMGQIASWGYIVAASQYRGNMGGEGKEEFGGSDVNDILNLIPLLSHITRTDTSRIGMYGWSRGGMMTYLTIAKTTRMKAAIIGSGAADFFMTVAKRPDMESVLGQLVPGYNLDRDSVFKNRSAIYWVDKLCKTTPLLLMTGSADWRVTPDEQLEMVNKLYQSKHPFRFIFFEGGQHSLAEHFTEVNHAARNFLDRYVRDKIMWPSLEPHGN